MGPGQTIAASILISAAMAATDEPAPAPSHAAKASTDLPKEPAPPPSVTVIGAYDARGILGRDVKGTADETMGRIVDVIVDRAGTVHTARSRSISDHRRPSTSPVRAAVRMQNSSAWHRTSPPRPTKRLPATTPALPN